MRQAPKGGKYVYDGAGSEVFYQGGQFLPEELPASAKKATKLKTKATKQSITFTKVTLSHYQKFMVTVHTDTWFKEVPTKTADINEAYQDAKAISAELSIPLEIADKLAPYIVDIDNSAYYDSLIEG